MKRTLNRLFIGLAFGEQGFGQLPGFVELRGHEKKEKLFSFKRRAPVIERKDPIQAGTQPQRGEGFLSEPLQNPMETLKITTPRS